MERKNITLQKGLKDFKHKIEMYINECFCFYWYNILGVIKIFGKIFLKGFNLEFSRLNKRLKAEFRNIRHEFEEHLQAINENTNEISANYE